MESAYVCLEAAVRMRVISLCRLRQERLSISIEHGLSRGSYMRDFVTQLWSIHRFNLLQLYYVKLYIAQGSTLICLNLLAGIVDLCLRSGILRMYDRTDSVRVALEEI